MQTGQVGLAGQRVFGHLTIPNHGMSLDVVGHFRIQHHALEFIDEKDLTGNELRVNSGMSNIPSLDWVGDDVGLGREFLPRSSDP